MRIGHLAHGARQVDQERLAEARAETGARQRQQVAEAAQAETFDAPRQGWRQFQRGQRYRRQGGARGRQVGAHRIAAGPRQPQRGQRRGRHRQLRIDRQRGEIRPHQAQQRRQAAEQAQAAGYFKAQRRRDEVDLRREAPGPAG